MRLRSPRHGAGMNPIVFVTQFLPLFPGDEFIERHRFQRGAHGATPAPSVNRECAGGPALARATQQTAAGSPRRPQPTPVSILLLSRARTSGRQIRAALGRSRATFVLDRADDF